MKPLLMQSLPNSGSTWFAATLAEHIPGCRYFQKEFFNPPCNLKHELILREQFGSEMMCCYRNIALPGEESIHEDIMATWGVEDYTFTKECNSAFKTEVFLRHFKVFVFLRSFENTFPPGRGRVWSFYEHAWFALKEAGHALRGVTTPERCYEAHRILTAAVLADAKRFDVPVIWWEEVMGDASTVMGRLYKVADVSDSFIDAIHATARLRE